MNVNEQAAVPNSIMLEDRKRLNIEGVREIGAYDDVSISAQMDVGLLTIRGSGLKIIRMSVDTGELSVEGTVSELAFADAPAETGGFWSRVFR